MKAVKKLFRLNLRGILEIETKNLTPIEIMLVMLVVLAFVIIIIVILLRLCFANLGNLSIIFSL